MTQNKSQQKLFLVFLEMPKGGIRNVDVKASDAETAGRRAMKRTKGALKVIRVDRGI